MYSLLSIFIIIPLIYSHTFARFGEDFVIENGIGNFESVKVSVFFLLLFSATLEFIIGNKEFLSRKTSEVVLSTLSFIIIEYFLFGPQSVFGIGEKQHGTLFFAGLVWFGYLLTLVEKSSFHLFQRAIIRTALFVSLVALIEYLYSYTLFTGYIYENPQSWGNGRATATLGNPNYVAGYLLMVLPIIVSGKNHWKKYSALTFLLLGIFSTGSFIGIAISCFYFLFLILKKVFKRNLLGILLIIFGLTLIPLSFMLSGSEKWLSFVSRFVLMKETLISLVGDVSSIFLGKGPNGIIEYFEGTRTQEIIQYFPNNMIIDSSHNIFIDILYKFGLLGIFGILFVLKKLWKWLDITSKSMLFLGVCFFSLNVSILSTLILFIFALTKKGENR